MTDSSSEPARVLTEAVEAASLDANGYRVSPGAEVAKAYSDLTPEQKAELPVSVRLAVQQLSKASGVYNTAMDALSRALKEGK